MRFVYIRYYSPKRSKRQPSLEKITRPCASEGGERGIIGSEIKSGGKSVMAKWIICPLCGQPFEDTAAPYAQSLVPALCPICLVREKERDRRRD